MIIRDETVGRPGAGPEDFQISAPQCLVARGDIGFSITPAFAHFEIGGQIKHALRAAWARPGTRSGRHGLEGVDDR